MNLPMLSLTIRAMILVLKKSDTNMFAVRPISSEDQSCTNQVYLFVQQVSPNKLDLSHVMGTFSTYVLPKYATQHGLSSERKSYSWYIDSPK